MTTPDSIARAEALTAHRQSQLERVFDVVSKFIRDNSVTCAEATVEDRIYENAPGFVEELADIVGYHEDEDD